MSQEPGFPRGGTRRCGNLRLNFQRSWRGARRGLVPPASLIPARKEEIKYLARSFPSRIAPKGCSLLSHRNSMASPLPTRFLGLAGEREREREREKGGCALDVGDNCTQLSKRGVCRAGIGGSDYSPLIRAGVALVGRLRRVVDGVSFWGNRDERLIEN